MDKKKSQKLSRSSFIDVKEGLSFSDYFDDSVPYEQKPPEMIRPMQEDDFPTQAKSLFAGLWESPEDDDILKPEYQMFWLDPQGKFYKTDNHAAWVRSWFRAHNLTIPENQTAYQAAFKRGYIRVWKNKYEYSLHFQYGDRGDIVVTPNHKQMSALKDAAIELNYRLYDDLKNVDIDLDESLMLENALKSGNKEIKLFQERYDEEESSYWLSPDGEMTPVGYEGHVPFAAHHLSKNRISVGGGGYYEAMYKLGWVRIYDDGEEIHIAHNPSREPNHVQWREIRDMAATLGREIWNDTTNRPIELEEGKSGRNLFIESMMPDDMNSFKSHLAQLFQYLQKELQLKTVPKVKLLSDDKNAAKVLGKTAYYEPETRTVVLYIVGRHQKDILRSFAHEVIHHWQHEHERLQTSSRGGTKEGSGESPSPKDDTTDPQYAQNNPWLRQMEKQAYLLGNILFRDWEDQKKAKDRKSGKKMVEADLQAIPLDTPYGVIDGQTKKVVFRTTYANRNRARRFADKKDLEYGAHRYYPTILRGEQLKEKTILIGKEYPPKKADYRG